MALMLPSLLLPHAPPPLWRLFTPLTTAKLTRLHLQAAFWYALAMACLLHEVWVVDDSKVLFLTSLVYMSGPCLRQRHLRRVHVAVAGRAWEQ